MLQYKTIKPYSFSETTNLLNKYRIDNMIMNKRRDGLPYFCDSSYAQADKNPLSFSYSVVSKFGQQIGCYLEKIILL